MRAAVRKMGPKSLGSQVPLLLSWVWPWFAPLFLLGCVVTAAGQQRDGTAPAPAAADPVLQAMSEELNRSKPQLRMDNLPVPYYIEFHVSDVDEFSAEASFGALRLNQRTHVRSLRVVVRVGDYKQDSYGPGPGMGVADLAPLDNDPVALRRALWLAADRAYKAATQTLANKKATMSQFSANQEFDDFAHAQPLQSIRPLAKLDIDTKLWTELLVKSSALFRTDPKIQSLSAQVRFRVLNEYFVNSEGTVTRQGSEVDSLAISGSTQAADGMRLDPSKVFVASKTADLPTPEKFQAVAAGLVDTVKALREAPVVEEDYRGPVLFAPDAAADEVFAMIGPMVGTNANLNVAGGRGGSDSPSRRRQPDLHLQEPRVADVLVGGRRSHHGRVWGEVPRRELRNR